MTRAMLAVIAVLAACGGSDAENITIRGVNIRTEVRAIDCRNREVCGFLDTSIGDCQRFDSFCNENEELCTLNYLLDADAYNGCIDAIDTRTCPEVRDAVVPGECIRPELNPIYQILVRE
jgi:hypothetical protein